MSIPATAHATAASTPITLSSGATATLPAVSGQTLYLQKAFVLNGASLVSLVTGDVTITGLSAGTLSIPIGQLLSQTTQVELDFSTTSGTGLPASAPNTAIALSIPALLGGAETTLLLQGVYF
jgi:hypothetical protein